MLSYPTENRATGGLNKSFSTLAEPQPLWPLVATTIYRKYTNHLLFSFLHADTELARPRTFILPILSLLCKRNMCIWKIFFFVINCKGFCRVFSDHLVPHYPWAKGWRKLSWRFWVRTNYFWRILIYNFNVSICVCLWVWVEASELIKLGIRPIPIILKLNFSTVL